MHDEALAWVARWATDAPVAVLDIGGRNINGTCRPLFPNATYVSLDLVAGPDVGIVADAATWEPDRPYDIVICAEVFEHTASWPAICETAHKASRRGGRFIMTCAGPGRPEHSAHDGGRRLRPEEWYRNVEPDELEAVLTKQGWQQVEINRWVNDLRATAVR